MCARSFTARAPLPATARSSRRNGKGTQGPAGKRGAGGDEAGDAQPDKDGGKRAATVKRKRPKLTATMLRVSAAEDMS